MSFSDMTIDIDPNVNYYKCKSGDNIGRLKYSRNLANGIVINKTITWGSGATCATEADALIAMKMFVTKHGKE